MFQERHNVTSSEEKHSMVQAADNLLPVVTPDTARSVARLTPEIKAILGPPPLLEGEDVNAYDALHDRLRAAVVPVDMVDELLVKSLLDLAWEGRRLRLHKAVMIRFWAKEGLAAAMSSITDARERNNLVDGWFDRDPKVVREVERLFLRIGPVSSVIAAHTMARYSKYLESISSEIRHADANWNANLRELDRHSAARAQRVANAVDAEFTEVELAPGEMAA